MPRAHQLIGTLSLGLLLVALPASSNARPDAASNGDVAPFGEVGDTDFQISFNGPPDDVGTFSAFRPAVAASSSTGEMLVVWQADDSTDGELEIWGQLLAADGRLIGANIRISDMGPDGDPSYDAIEPAVAYNSIDDEFLVVWSGQDDASGIDEVEVYGQRLTPGGFAVGANDFAISEVGPAGDLAYKVEDPAVAHDPISNTYLVVWEGVDVVGGVDENEIFGQVLNADGTEAGTDDFRISDNGPAGDSTFSVAMPDLALHPANGEYLVVWSGDSDDGDLVSSETEIFGQRVTVGGALVGSQVRISEMGPDGDPTFDAFEPAIAFNPDLSEYLVAWESDDDTPPLVDGEDEIYVRRLDAEGTTLATQQRITTMGPDGDTSYDAEVPDVAYLPASGEYFVVFAGDDDSVLDDEFEIWGQRLDSQAQQIGDDDFRISTVGGDGEDRLDADTPRLAYNQTTGEVLAVFKGESAISDNRIFGQRFALNESPLVQPIADRADDELEIVTLQVDAEDPDGGTLTYGATNVPDGLAIDPDTGLISGTLASDSTGVYEVEVTVTDDGTPQASEMVTFSWVVFPIEESPALVPVADRTLSTDEPFTLPIEATDPDGDELTYGASGLPPGLAIDNATGVLSGTPTVPGVYDVTVTVTDGIFLVETSFQWQIVASIFLDGFETGDTSRWSLTEP